MGERTYPAKRGKSLPSNRHHPFYNRRFFEAEPTTKALREYDRAIIRLPIPVHNDLHQEIGSMPVPKPFLARLALEHMLDLPERYDSLDTLTSTSEYLREISEQMQPQALEMAEHLDRQMPHLKLGHFALKKRHL